MVQGLRGVGRARCVVLLDHRVAVLRLSDAAEERPVVDDARAEGDHVVAVAAGGVGHAVLGVEQRVALVVAADQGRRVEDVLLLRPVEGGVGVELVLGDVGPEDVHLQPYGLRVGHLQEVLELTDAGAAGGPPLRVQRSAVEQEAVGRVVVVRVQLDARAARDPPQGVPLVGGHVPVGPVGAAGGVATGAHVLHAEDVRDLQVPLELVQVALAERPGGRDEAVVALGAQTVLVQPGAQQLRAFHRLEVTPAGCVGVLAVPGELDLPVAEAGQLLEDLAEPRGEVGAERVPARGVAHGVQDDAPLVRRDESLAVAVAVPRSGGGLGEGRRRAEGGRGDRRRRGGGAGAEEAPAADAEAAAQAAVRSGCVVVHGHGVSPSRRCSPRCAGTGLMRGRPA